MNSVIERRRALAAIRNAKLPDRWCRVSHGEWEVGAFIHVSETDHRIAGHLSMVALGSSTGLVDVTLNGCEIRCDADDVQAAVDHCLAWWRAHPPPPFE